MGITGISPEAEPSAARLAELTKYVKENDIKIIYFEENASEKIAKTLAEEAGVELAVLNPIESLTKEEMDKGEDYISVMRENLEALKKTTDQPGKDIQPEHAEDEKTVHKGYFEDSAVKDRTLSDYAGGWQSVYPYLVDGTLDPVFDYKAKIGKKMTKDEYKAYYTTGYKTDIKNINITDTTMEFQKEDGTTAKAEYKYVGYKILTYKKGNRGVRFLFEAVNPVEGAPKYVQFSDHNIAPVKAEHFHIFMGNESQEKLFEEMDNWPTYYPSNLTGLEIAQEMVAH